MKIFICDDEPKMLSDIVSKVRAIAQESEIWDYTDARKLLAGLDEESCDVLLLDIDMPGLGGLDVAKHLTDRKKKPLLVFVNGHDELVYDSLQFHPFGFVRKNELDGRKKRFVFENKSVQIHDLMNFLLKTYSVRDINISEPEIESIIRKIYNGEAVSV